ncbi:MAG: RNA polymerase sigma-70 factor [Bacteroidales bacterium]|nr:RNA polymerase sigma-70 factor [Bacteroidales bacterium]
MQKFDENKLLDDFRNNDLEAFEHFFKTNQPQMVAFAHKFLDDWETSRDIVQEIFLNLWENKNNLTINISLRAYLFTAVKNQCANYIKHKSIEQKYSDKTMIEFSKMESDYYMNTDEPFHKLYEKELNNKIKQSINSLPEQCRHTFELSRYNGLKSHEIAKKLEVSVRTVETQIYRALKTLKESLKD